MKHTLLFLSAFLLMNFSAKAQTKLETSELTGTYKYSSANVSPYGIHDPSVVWDSSTKTFYVFGSHYAGAKTTNLRNWTGIGNYYQGGYNSENAYKVFKSNPTHKVMRCLPGSTVQEEVTLGSYDASAFCSIYSGNEAGWVQGDQWAPDIIYNPNMGKWCIYLSLNGDNWASVVVLLTSDNPTGPYTYVAPIVFGGFNNNSYSGKKVDYKNTDLELVLGTQSSLPGRYNKGTSWGSFWPNCIDPCVFFDEEGELWIAYGSWSGGIWMLKLDKQTGLRDYTYTYSGTASSVSQQQTSDAYFGKLIAGGAYVSGEGPYIQHIGDYYYLFMSYGFFSPDGGYEIRIFRSSDPTGPYLDASGNNAINITYQMNYGPKAATNKGMKVIGAYNGWGLQTMGECAHGHNSACQDDDGRTYLVCHSKFNNGTAAHAMRVHQLFLNEKGWLCAAPFVFNGETITDADIATTQPWTPEDIEGDYQFLIHPYRLDYEKMQESTPKSVHLSADGKITGAYTGTWKYSSEGSSYIQLNISGTIYYGVITEQALEGTNNSLQTVTANVKTLCLSAVSNGGVPVWGFKWQPQYAIAYNYNQHSSAELKTSLFSSVKSNIDIAFTPEHGVSLEWISSNPDILSETGKYNPGDTDETVTMTARLTAGKYYWERESTAKCLAATELTGDPYSGLVAYYNFDETPTRNVMNEDEKITYGRSQTSSTAPTLETDYSRFGQVCHQYAANISYNSYSKMPNPLLNAERLEGFTVSLWVNRVNGTDYYNALWGFFNSIIAGAAGERLYLTGNSYIGYNDNAGNWFDVNHPDTKVVTSIKAGEWHLVTFTFSATDGYMLYLDGKKYLTTNRKYTGSVSEKEFDWSRVTDFASSAQYFYLGLGSFWGSAEAYFDDLMIYNRALTDDDVSSLYTLLNRVSPFSDGTVTSIDAPEAEVADLSPATAPQGIFDLTGRRVQIPAKGIYIVNGKKVWIK